MDIRASTKPRVTRSVERRRQQRDQVNCAVTLLVENEHGGTLQQAQLIDISVSGARLHSYHQIPLRACVYFFHERLRIGGRGSVRHCASSRRGFDIGLEFASGTGWKPLAEAEPIAAAAGPAGFEARRPASSIC